MKYRSQFSLDLFDHMYPSVGRAKEKYTFIDKSEYKGLTRNDIADAVLNLKHNEALIIPAGMYWGNETFRHKKSGTEIPIDSPARFRKFGPQIDIVKSDVTIREIKDKKLTPRNVFKQVLSDSETREKLKNGNYRGIGFWSPRSRRHNIIWFDVLAEGQKYLDTFNKEFGTGYQFADAYQYVPSFQQIEGVRTTPLKVLPVTERDGEFYVEWLEEYAQCSCADAFFMGARGKKKIDHKFEGIYKYMNPEQIICRHNWAQRILAEKEPEKNPDAKPLLVKLPKATGFLEPWRKTKMQVYIRYEKGLRRPYKAEITAGCGNFLGILEPDYAFDLSE